MSRFERLRQWWEEPAPPYLSTSDMHWRDFVYPIAWMLSPLPVAALLAWLT